MKYILPILMIFNSLFSSPLHITFIINPISHELKDQDVETIIKNTLDQKRFAYKIRYTEYAGHGATIAREELKTADIIAAVGGDGTVNEVGKELIHQTPALAIIPVGSGNGLARHLKIPVGLQVGISALNQASFHTIDTAKINDTVFLGVAGLGFDARVAHAFSSFGKRGLFSYFQVAVKEFAKYQPQSYRITIEGKTRIKKAFVLTIANSSQYGNDFTIAPHAEIADGKLELVIINELPWYSAAKCYYLSKNRRLDHFPYYESYPFEEALIEGPIYEGHVDGEPVFFEGQAKIAIQPHSLKMFY